jgi:hypothetical protein
MPAPKKKDTLGRAFTKTTKAILKDPLAMKTATAKQTAKKQDIAAYKRNQTKNKMGK